MYDEAYLIMDSRQDLSSLDDWTKLFRAEAHYLDLCLQTKGQQKLVHGQLLPIKPEVRVSGMVSLDIGNQKVSSELFNDGHFQFLLEQAELGKLVIELPQSTIVIPYLQ